MPQQEEAPADLFVNPPGEWVTDIEDPDLQYADDERQRRIASWQSLPAWARWLRCWPATRS